MSISQIFNYAEAYFLHITPAIYFAKTIYIIHPDFANNLHLYFNIFTGMLQEFFANLHHIPNKLYSCKAIYDIITWRLTQEVHFLHLNNINQVFEKAPGVLKNTD
jgi:hypothetical protein